MIEGLKRVLRISDPADRRISASRRAHPGDDELVESPSLDRNLALLSLKNREAEFLYGKTVTDRRNQAKPARTGLRRNCWLRGCLGQLFIAPNYQGQGLGKRLLAFAREQMPNEIWLRCVRENEKAWRWYEREGFVFEKEEVNPMTGFTMKIYRWRKSG